MKKRNIKKRATPAKVFALYINVGRTWLTSEAGAHPLSVRWIAFQAFVVDRQIESCSVSSRSLHASRGKRLKLPRTLKCGSRMSSVWKGRSPVPSRKSRMNPDLRSYEQESLAVTSPAMSPRPGRPMLSRDCSIVHISRFVDPFDFADIVVGRRLRRRRRLHSFLLLCFLFPAPRFLRQL